jgi:hypothetical protein
VFGLNRSALVAKGHAISGAAPSFLIVTSSFCAIDWPTSAGKQPEWCIFLGQKTTTRIALTE